MDRIGDDDRAALRRAVHALRRHERRRVFPPRLHVGDPDGGRVSRCVSQGVSQGVVAALGPLPDPTLCTDVVGAMLRRRPEGEASAVWLTRAGVPEPHDLDLRWLPAALRAFAEAGEPPRWAVVVTKNGWYDPRTGEGVTWQRLRIRR